MVASAQPSVPEREEAQKNRPYRRFVIILFFAAIAVPSVLVLRGIIRHLDRLPSVESLHQLETVDARALRACADDLQRLETQIRVAAGVAFAAKGAAGEKGADWPKEAQRFELERVKIVARCRLHEGHGDPVVEGLSAAATGVEDLLRSYSLLFDRHREDGRQRSKETIEAISNAQKVLDTR